MEPAQNLQKAPDHLSAAMKAWWADVLARHGVPDSHRLYLLEAACGAWDRLEGARQTLAREGITVAGRYGPRTHPAVGVERDARLAFARLLTQLDLDPPPERRIGGHGVTSFRGNGSSPSAIPAVGNS